MPNLYRNGDLELGSVEGWPSGNHSTQWPEYVPGDAPTGLPGSIRYQPVPYNAGPTDALFREVLQVRSGDALWFEVWVKADKPGSIMYWETRTPDNVHLTTTQGANRWTSIEGGAGKGSAYPISEWEVPTEWTKVASRLFINSDAPVGSGTVYLNHPSGATRDARVSFAGARLYVENSKPGIVDNWFTPAQAGLTPEHWDLVSVNGGNVPTIDYSIQTPTGSNAIRLNPGGTAGGGARFLAREDLPLVVGERYVVEYDIMTTRNEPLLASSPGLRFDGANSVSYHMFLDDNWRFTGIEPGRWVHRRAEFEASGGRPRLSSYFATSMGAMWISGIKVSKVIEPMPIAEPMMDNLIDEEYLVDGPYEVSPFYGNQGFHSGTVTRGREAPGIYSFTIAAGTVATSNYALMSSFHARGGTDRPSSLYFPVTPGGTIKVEYAAATAGRHPTPDSAFEAMVYFYTQDQWGNVTGANARQLPPDSNGRFSGTLDVPEGKNAAVFYARAANYMGAEVQSPIKALFSNLYVGDVDPKGAVAEVGVATSAREGLVSDVFVRSREKIEVQLARPDEQLIAGERIELAAFAATSTEVSWTWRQVTGPTVQIERRDNAAHFIAPDVDRPTDLRIACRAASTDGANRSNWHFFDLTIQPPRTRWIPDEGAEFTPRSPQMVGYDRGKREIWNDVTLPNGMDPDGRWENVLRDLGIPADDVQFVTDGEPPARAAAGGVYIDMETRDIYRNFGGGYNESDDTEGAPRRNAYMVNPATGDIFEWREGES